MLERYLSPGALMIREVCRKLANSASERRALSVFLNYGQLIMKC